MIEKLTNYSEKDFAYIGDNFKVNIRLNKTPKFLFRRETFENKF